MITLVLEGIIFDLDGTIVNSTEVQWYAFNEYLKQFNVQISWYDWTRVYLGKKSSTIWKAIVDKHKLNINIDKAQKKRRSIYSRLVNEGKLREINGFTAFFNWLKKSLNPSIPIVIASNGHITSIETSLKAIGYLNQINYYSAGSASQKMTKESLLRLVVNDLKINSKNCLVLEDSPMGAIAAKKNFMKVIIINTSNLPKNDFNVNLLIDDYTSPELFSFLAKASNHGT